MSREFRLGLFIVGTLLILTTGVFLIGSKQFLFRRTYRVKADFPNVGGLIEGRVMSAEQVRQTADLPSREVLLAQLLGTLQSPIAQLVGTIQAPLQQLVGLLEAYRNKLEAQEA